MMGTSYHTVPAILIQDELCVEKGLTEVTYTVDLDVDHAGITETRVAVVAI